MSERDVLPSVLESASLSGTGYHESGAAIKTPNSVPTQVVTSEEAQEWGSGVARRLGLPRHDWVKFGEIALAADPRVGDGRYARLQCRKCHRFAMEALPLDWTRSENGWCGFPEVGGDWTAGGFRGRVQVIDLERGVFTIKNDAGEAREFALGAPDETPTAELVAELREAT